MDRDDYGWENFSGPGFWKDIGITLLVLAGILGPWLVLWACRGWSS